VPYSRRLSSRPQSRDAATWTTARASHCKINGLRNAAIWKQ
jgi:hypothetical protein